MITKQLSGVVYIRFKHLKANWVAQRLIIQYDEDCLGRSRPIGYFSNGIKLCTKSKVYRIQLAKNPGEVFETLKYYIVWFKAFPNIKLCRKGIIMDWASMFADGKPTYNQLAVDKNSIENDEAFKEFVALNNLIIISEEEQYYILDGLKEDLRTFAEYWSC